VLALAGCPAQNDTIRLLIINGNFNDKVVSLELENQITGLNDEVLLDVIPSNTLIIIDIPADKYAGQSVGYRIATSGGSFGSALDLTPGVSSAFMAAGNLNNQFFGVVTVDDQTTPAKMLESILEQPTNSSAE
jgi:hypothetical protein